MHELDIAKRISKAIFDEASKRGFKDIKSIKLEIGRANAVHPDQLILFIKQSGKIFQNCRVNIDVVDILLKCSKCRNEFDDERFVNEDFAHSYSHAPALYIPKLCPKCGCESSVIIKGTELKLISIEGC